MSGIVGIVNLDGAPIDRDLLWRMTDFMAVRGPDAQQIWIDGNVGLGHTMLCTTSEAETEKQPLSLDGKVWLTADARIDGRAELIGKLETESRAKLRVAGDAAREPNDPELILNAYHTWGEDCVKHLIGDFAFGIWDGRERKLFCGRDHFGVKPFYYAQYGTTFIFSNTLNAVRLHPNVSDELNDIAIGDFLLFGVNQDLSTTTFRDIDRLPGASRICASVDGLRSERFWSAPHDRQINFSDDSQYVECFNDLLIKAVDDRLRTNQVSISMSGGLDSTSVAVVAKELLRQQSDSHQLNAFCVVYDKLIPDQERYYSGLAASAIGIPITHIAADDYELYEQRSPHDLNQPEPFLMNPKAAQFNELLRLTGSTGRVSLTGWDGDAFMSEPPHSHFAALARKFKFLQLTQDMLWFVRYRRQLPPIGVRTTIKRMLGTYPRKFVFPEWIGEDFCRKVDLRERLKKFNVEPKMAPSTHPHAMRVLNSTSWAPLFESFDAGISHLPLEMRHPLIDVRLVEFLLAVPPVPWCANKEILRRAMKNKLPSAIVNRPKTPLAGDPALQLVKQSKVRCLDGFDRTRRLTQFIDLEVSPGLAACEENADRLWANLRLFGLNHWLTHSLPIKQNLENT